MVDFRIFIYDLIFSFEFLSWEEIGFCLGLGFYG